MARRENPSTSQGSAELERLGLLGWEPVPESDDGVRWMRRDGAEVSYPRGVSDHLSGEDGSSFWLDARADAVGRLGAAAAVSTLWDVGAGSGAMAKRLGSHGIEVISVEPLPEGAIESGHLGHEVFCATLEDLELPHDSLPAVGLFDVVEHLEDPALLLAEVSRVLIPGGKLLVTVPAYQWLWSAEDEALGHFRRYSTRSISGTLRAGGFSVLSSQYLFASLVPPAAVLRTLPYRLGRKRDAEQVLSCLGSRLEPGVVGDHVIRWALATEAAISRRVPMPFGLSVLALAQLDGAG